MDWYNGGMEHTTLHLLYSRFWHKFLYDIGAVPSPEPYQKRTAHGMILGLNPHSFVNLPAEEQDKLLKEYGSQKAAEKALEEKYGEMSRHPIVKMSKSWATSSTRTRWWTSTVLTPCVCTRCSWATLSRLHRGRPLPLQAATASWTACGR